MDDPFGGTVHSSNLELSNFFCLFCLFFLGGGGAFKIKMCTFHFMNTYMDCLGQLEQMSSEILLEDFLTITWCNNCVLTNPSCCSRSRSASNVGGDTNFSSGWQHFEWVPLFTFSKLAFHIKRVNCEHAHLVVLMWVEQILKHQQLKKAKMESSLVESVKSVNPEQS